MLGEQIVDEKGAITSQRVLPTEDGLPKLEVSFQSTGTFMGRGSIDRGTYVAKAQPDGSIVAEGQGVVATVDGQAVTWSGFGVGRLTPANGDYTVSYRGAIHYRAATPGIVEANGRVAVFEFDVDAQNVATAKAWEWK